MTATSERVVEYTLTANDASQISRRRIEAANDDARQAWASSGWTPLFTGNGVNAGDTFPLVITRIWGERVGDGSFVNGQVMLDGNDTLWVMSIKEGPAPGEWRPYPRS